MSASDGSARLCAYCGATLKGRQRRFCERRCNCAWWCEEQTRLRSIAVQAARQEHGRTGACLDCHGPLTVGSRGPLPTRCRPCKAAQDAARLRAAGKTHHARAAAAKAARRARRRCSDCTRPLGPPPHRAGRVPARCSECKREHDRERQQRRNQRRHAKEREARRRKRWPLLWGGSLPAKGGGR